MPTLDRKKLARLVKKKDFKKIYEIEGNSWWISVLPDHLKWEASKCIDKIIEEIQQEKNKKDEKFNRNQIKQHKRLGGVLENRKSKNILKFEKRVKKENLIAKENNKHTWPYIMWENYNLTGKLVKMLPLHRNNYYGLRLYIVEYEPHGPVEFFQRNLEMPNDRDSYAFYTGRYMAEVDENSLMPKHWPEDHNFWYELFLDQKKVFVQKKFFTSI